jgi:hypothetical protein
VVVDGAEVDVDVVDGDRRPCPTAVVFVVLGASVVVVLATAVGTVTVAAAVVGRPVVEVVPGEDLTVVVGEVRRARGVGVAATVVGTEGGTAVGIVVGVVVVGTVVASVEGTGSVVTVEVVTGADVSVVVPTLSAFFGGSPLVTTKAMAAAAAAAAIPQTHPFL